jgi:hypothetical protein
VRSLLPPLSLRPFLPFLLPSLRFLFPPHIPLQSLFPSNL